jgi:replication factor C large subunit
MQWTEEYAPPELDDVAGNPSARDAVVKWAENWKPGDKALLLVGGPGVGKTATALALARTMHWDLLEMNSSEQRNKQIIERVAGLASVSTTFSGNRRMILFDEADGLFRNDRGGTTAMLEVVKGAASPIVLTANDAYAKQLSTIKKYCDKVSYKKVHYGTIKKTLERIAVDKGVDADPVALEKLAKNAHGDLKAAINDFQALAEGRKTLTEEDVMLTDRDRMDNIFNAMRAVFKATEFRKARDVFDTVREDPDLFLKWVDENIPREYEDKEDIAAAFQQLARADTFYGRIRRRQSWLLMKYTIDLMTAGVALAKKEPYHKFTPYSFPQFISLLARSKAKRGLRDAIALKMGEKLHASKKEVIQHYIPYYMELFAHEKQAVDLSAFFGFDEKEIEFFGYTAAKAKKIYEKADAVHQKIVAESLVDKNQSSLASFS